MFVSDYILNGRPHGPVGEMLFNVGGAGDGVRYDPGMLRPFIEDNPTSPFRGQPCVIVNTGKYKEVNGEPKVIYKQYLISELQARGINSPVWANNATMIPRQVWIQIDRTVVKSTRQRLSAWRDLEATNPVGGFDAMGKLTYEYDYMNDVGEAVVDMDAIAAGRQDIPLLGTASVPLPITHSDFDASERRLAVSRNSSAPYDTTMAEMAGRRIGETIEQTTIGTITGMTYGTRSTGFDVHRGTSTVYGYTNFPYRVTKTDLNTPTGTNPEAVVQDVMEMMETMYTNGFFGPFGLYMSTGYSIWLNSDYFRSGSTSAVRTVRERLMELENLSWIRRLDYLTSGYQMILVSMTSETCQAINGMEVTTVQWPSLGGLRQNFKSMCIKVPLMKAPYNGIGGIIHGTTS